MRLTSFVGREAEIVELDGLLDRFRLVVVAGTGGCGKTRLALEVARHKADQFPDGAWFVDLTRISDPSLVTASVHAAIANTFDDGESTLGALASYLADRHALIVLDNCEHLVGECATVVSALLAACPRISVLATSRETLDIEGEVVWRLRSLSVPASEDVTVERASTSEAVRLFIDRATAVRSTFALTSENCTAVTDICRRLDGIPLAVELAAAATRAQRTHAIAAALEQQLDSLRPRRDSLPRQRTLTASLAWSYGRLSTTEQDCFRRLSIFVGGFTVGAAAEVTASGPTDGSIIVETLTALVDKSLIEMDDDVDGSRYRMLETTRQFAARMLALSDRDETETRNRHLEWVMTLIEDTRPRRTFGGSGRVDWFDRISSELPNVRAALEWTRVSGRGESMLRIAGGLVAFWSGQGYWTEGNHWLHLALAKTPDAPPEVRAPGLLGIAQLNFTHADHEMSLTAAHEALRIIGEESDSPDLVTALRLVGLSQLFTDPAAAVLVLEQTADLARSRNDAVMVADLLIASSLARFLGADFDGMRRRLEDAVGIATSHATHSRELGNALVCLGTVLAIQGEIVQARQHIETGLVELLNGGDAFWPVFGLAVLGDIHSLAGHYDEARSTLDAALAQGRDLESPDIIGLPTYFLGWLALAVGDLDGARNRLQEAVTRSREIGSRLFLSWSLRELAMATSLLGNRGAAVEQIDEALAMAHEIDAPQPIAFALQGVASIAYRDGDVELAESRWHEALRLQRTAGDTIGIIDGLEALAMVAASRDSLAEAARLFAVAENARERIGYARPGPDGDDVARQRRRVRDLLEPSEHAARRDEGRRLTVDEACDYASRARGERKRPSSGWASLTPTELHVVRLVAQGMTNRAVGEQLFVRPWTVKTHLSSVFAKLGVTTRSALTAEAVRRGDG
jgi:predicted ATPase/DNA-binding CsgD family transcriptional regulator